MGEVEQDDDLGWVMAALERILGVQRPLVVNHLRSLRRKHPGITPAQTIERLEKQYLAAVSTGGAAVGATAVAPGIGTAAALGLTVAETVGFLEATAFFGQAVTEVHGIAVEDEQRAKALVMALMLGSGGSALVKRAAEQATGRARGIDAHWGQLITSAMPTGAMGQVIDYLRRAFLRRMARNTGASMVGRAMPFGIGAVIGGVGNNILGRQVVKAAREAFGPAPREFDANLAPRIKEVRPSLGQRIKEARAIEREGLGGGLRRLRERRAGDADGAPPMQDASVDAPSDSPREGGS
ncbi:hypothetical protein [Agrococcus carbonis]|uniref:EcsC protein family protein n=1 Tax=Agrococcus carbonis TaxID=684552 RepID=A0A1H1LGU1_9MICO|nr:hypothetical protein [Agrococcus carbonis]SDR73552.1 hypothetical protein SAMN04489719_0591 [Agrococcus carbonis]